MKGIPEKWQRTDEWYNYKNINADLNVVATLDEDSYEGGENGKDHPIAWWHDYDGGRAFLYRWRATQQKALVSLYS